MTSNDPVFQLHFDGAGSYIEIPDSEDFSVPTTGALTVSAWIRPDTLNFPSPEGSGYVHWLGKGERGRQEWVFRMYNQENTENPPRPNRISFYVFNAAGGEGVGSYFQEALTAGEWIHVVGAADGQRTYIYRDGSFKRCDQYQGPGDGSCESHPLTIRPQHGTAPLRIGTRDFRSFFQGAIRDVTIWNRLLMADEIAALHASDTVPPDGLVAEFRLNADIALDGTGLHNGVIAGATWQAAEGGTDGASAAAAEPGSAPGTLPLAVGFRRPPKPADYEHGAFAPVPHDRPGGQTVIEATAPADDSYTAEITAGSPYFLIAKINTYDLVLQEVDQSELPPGHRGAVFYWDMQDAGSSDGVTPLAVKKGQKIDLLVEVLVRDRALPPGPFSGTALLKSKSFSQAVALTGTFLSVNENSPIGKKWHAMGGEARLGTVEGNEQPAPDGIGTMQGFVNGVLYEAPGGAVFYFSPAVWAKWTSSSVLQAQTASGGTVREALGRPLEDTFATAEGGQALRFQGGAIVVRRDLNAYVVYGLIYNLYRTLGDLADPHRQPWLGLPTSDEGPATSSQGRVSHFDGADIWWTPNTGAHEVHGAIRDKWNNFGGVAGWLGFPLTDETGTPDGIGRFNRFQGGMIYWTPGTGAHEVHGDILGRWSALGYERSYLGYPVSDEGDWTMPITNQHGRVSVFQFGMIAWLPGSGPIEIPESITQNGQVLTPAGTALGGFVTMTLRSDGSFSAQFHMHDSGATGYDFTVRAIFVARNGLTFVAQHSGSVGGTFTSGSRDDDFTENNKNPLIASFWGDVKAGTMWVTKDYSATGLIGAIQDLAQALLDVAAGAVGGALGVIIGLTSEAIGWLGATLGPGGTFGVIAGVVVMAMGGGVLMAVVAGVTVGAVTNAMIDYRPMSAQEIQFASQVFGSQVPYDRVQLTNLAGIGGRPFTSPGVDGKIYVNLGDAYDKPNPVGYTNATYSAPGQVLIHELTHAWQIAHSGFPAGLVCAGIVNQANNQVGQSVYVYGPPGPVWSDFNQEQQGAIVDQWFGGRATAVVPIRRPMDVNDPYFPYIRDNIRQGAG